MGNKPLNLCCFHGNCVVCLRDTTHVQSHQRICRKNKVWGGEKAFKARGRGYNGKAGGGPPGFNNKHFLDLTFFVKYPAGKREQLFVYGTYAFKVRGPGRDGATGQEHSVRIQEFSRKRNTFVLTLVDAVSAHPCWVSEPRRYHDRPKRARTWAVTKAKVDHQRDCSAVISWSS